MKNKLEDLRNHLFAELERLGDIDTPPDDLQLDRSRAICNVAKQITDTARLEVDFYRTLGKLRTDGVNAQGGEFFDKPAGLLK